MMLIFTQSHRYALNQNQDMHSHFHNKMPLDIFASLVPQYIAAYVRTQLHS